LGRLAALQKPHPITVIVVAVKTVRIEALDWNANWH